MATARSYLGVPFVHNGRTRFGLDCVGLLIVTGQALALLDHFQDDTYGRHIDAARLRAELETYLTPLPEPTAYQEAVPWQPGDVLLFTIRRNPQHTALLTETGPEPRFIHACQSARRVVEARLDSRWQERLVGVFRWKAFPIPEPHRPTYFERDVP